MPSRATADSQSGLMTAADGVSTPGYPVLGIKRVFHGSETLAKLLILNGLLKLAEIAISVSGSVALGHQ